MSTNTQNYNLVKPAEDEEYDIGVYNGNLDKVDNKIHSVENLLGDVSDYSFGSKSDIDLSSGDITLQEVDYCKGLLIISVAHVINTLILPTNDNFKYAIYNADEENTAIVKKVGGEPIEIASCTMVMVGYDGTDYRMIGGGASDATRFKPVDIDDTVQDLTVVGWDKDTGKWKTMQNGYALYYDGYIYSNGSRIPISGFEADDGLVAFVNEDGTLTSDSTKVRAGYIVEDGSNLLLDLKGDLGVVKEYTTNMQTTYAVIGKSQTVRVKSEMPADADGYYLCYKSVEWVEGDNENTGTLVGNFTENFIGDNVWYTVTGLQNDNTYYLKWFPYKGVMVNRSIGVNEDKVYVQNGIAFWSFDNIEGSQIIDGFYSHNLTNQNCSMSHFKIGNGLYVGSSSNHRCYCSDFLPSVYSASLFFETSTLSNKKCLWGETINSGALYGHWVWLNTDGVIKIETNDADGWHLIAFSVVLSPNTEYHLGLVLDFSSKIAKLYIDGVFIQSQSVVAPRTSALTTFYMGYRQSSGTYYGTMKLDQLYFYNGELTSSNFVKLYNGGAGC